MYAVPVFQNLISSLFLKIYLQKCAETCSPASAPGGQASSLHWLSGSSFRQTPGGNHLQMPVCKQMYMVGQQHFLPLEQLGGKENKCVLLSFVSYKTPLAHSHLEPIFLLFESWLVFDGKRNLPYLSFQVKRKFVLP